jgi:predicted O-methyltransferase YrrM
VRPVAVPLAIRSLRRASDGVSTVDEAVAVTASWSFLGAEIAPWQMRSEIRALLERVAAEAPRTILEIGTSNGGSLYLLARAAAPNGLLISVDLPRGPFGGGYPRWRAPLYRSFASPEQRIELLRGNSHSDAMFVEVQRVLGDRAIDFLFIDGDHSYEGVKTDFERYSTLVRPGGLIGLHDVVPQSATPRGREGAAEGDEFDSGEVAAFWQEIRTKHDSTEFVEDWSQGCFGIGLIEKH